MAPPVVLRIDPARADAVRAHLREAGFKFEDRPHALFLARRPGVTITFYASGKVLLTGAQADEYAGVLRHAVGLPEAPRAAGPVTGGGAEDAARTLGSDETGKGDYFGPLIVAAVAVPDEGIARVLREKGVRDSKAVKDDAARLLGSLVAARCPHHVEAFPPRRYNGLHARVGNLNVLLARAHADALDAVLRQGVDVERVIVDRFARGPRLEHALSPRARALPLTEEPRAESRHLAVAAASLLARAEFLRALSAMESEWGARFPKSGGGRGVEAAARRFVAEHGADALGDVAKLHFATTARVTRRG